MQIPFGKQIVGVKDANSFNVAFTSCVYFFLEGGKNLVRGHISWPHVIMNETTWHHFELNEHHFGTWNKLETTWLRLWLIFGPHPTHKSIIFALH